VYVGPTRVQKPGDWSTYFRKNPILGSVGFVECDAVLGHTYYFDSSSNTMVLHQLRLRGVATASRGDINQDDGLEYDKNHDKHVENVIRARRLASKRATRQNSVVQGVQNPERAVSMANRIFGIGPSHANMPASRLVHPSSPFHTVIIACVSTADTRQKRSQTILHGIRILQ
jgi:hypothetical protein